MPKSFKDYKKNISGSSTEVEAKNRAALALHEIMKLPALDREALMVESMHYAHPKNKLSSNKAINSVMKNWLSQLQDHHMTNIKGTLSTLAGHYKESLLQQAEPNKSLEIAKQIIPVVKHVSDLLSACKNNWSNEKIIEEITAVRKKIYHSVYEVLSFSSALSGTVDFYSFQDFKSGVEYKTWNFYEELSYRPTPATVEKDRAVVLVPMLQVTVSSLIKENAELKEKMKELSTQLRPASPGLQKRAQGPWQSLVTPSVTVTSTAEASSKTEQPLIQL